MCGCTGKGIYEAGLLADVGTFCGTEEALWVTLFLLGLAF